MDAPTKYCDLVMKGGITSGVVYPSAVLALAREFRFKSIGGTSAGAIAAAATAAASMGDRLKTAGVAYAPPPEKVGFEGLQTVSSQLSSQGFIFGLFQPAFGLRSAYRLLVLLTSKAAVHRKFLGAAVAILLIAPAETLLALALILGIGFLIAHWAGVLSGLFPAIVCAYLAGVIFAVLRVATVTRQNLLGFCTGMRPSLMLRKSAPALTEWLYQTLQELSGKALDDPLIFADLGTAPRYDNEPVSERTITLQMITTDLSHCEPRSLPITESTFWFVRAEFERLFPKQVVDWLIVKAGAPVEREGIAYYKLPTGPQLPVIVATRMSLSFPLLISAVPLHEPSGWQRRPEPGDTSDAQEDMPAQKTVLASADALTTGGGGVGQSIAGFRVCWFSDGGISSNFPIHLFDSALPRWPTFAIDLVPAQMGEHPTDDVFLPHENNQGWQRIYQTIAVRSAATELVKFVLAIVSTMQNWRDLLQSRAPGHRDRIAHVALSANEGGLNLNMPQDVLTSISSKGARAGAAFSEFSFSNHYWVRWRNLAATLQRFTIQASTNAQSPIVDYAAAFETAKVGAPPPPSYTFRSEAEQKELERLFGEMLRQGHEWNDLGVDLSARAPRPTPQLRITPIF